MQIIYKVAFDSAYCRAIIDHYYAQRISLEMQFASTLIPVLLWWLSQWWRGTLEIGATTIGIWLVVWLAAVVVGVLLTKWFILQRLTGKIEFGTEVTMILSEAGIEAIGEGVSGKWSWAAYPRSICFPDGILLQRAGVIRWLPNSAIQKGTPEQASELVASKTEFVKK